MTKLINKKTGSIIPTTNKNKNHPYWLKIKPGHQMSFTHTENKYEPDKNSFNKPKETLAKKTFSNQANQQLISNSVYEIQPGVSLFSKLENKANPYRLRKTIKIIKMKDLTQLIITFLALILFVKQETKLLNQSLIQQISRYSNQIFSLCKSTTQNYLIIQLNKQKVHHA